jgi:DNA-binding NtrC family response regulator
VKSKGQILIVEDDEASRELVQEMLAGQKFQVRTAQDGQEALDCLGDHFDLILTDLIMPRLDGIGLLKAVKDRGLPPAVIVMSAYATIESAIEATREGAYGYIVKPIKRDTLLHLLHRALEEQRLQRENELLRKELEQRHRCQDLLGKSSKMRELFRLLEVVATSESTILLQGESGTGKEMVARAIHAMSPRREQPFVAVNCGGLTETLLESELFGHVRGAFTGAVGEKKGLFHLAHSGTLFLDEIGETPLTMQVKLLRGLEEGEIRPVGGTHSIKVDVRFVAATNRNLEEALRTGTFRPDLFYRLNVIAIGIPPLRERTEDIPLLVDHFLAKANATSKKRIRGVSRQAMVCLLNYPWPGNVRELENAIERAVVLGRSELIVPEDLPNRVLGQDTPKPSPLRERVTLAELEKAHILAALHENGWHHTNAAEALGIGRTTLWRKMKAYQLETAA